jgi:hypothetical protein
MLRMGDRRYRVRGFSKNMSYRAADGNRLGVGYDHGLCERDRNLWQRHLGNAVVCDQRDKVLLVSLVQWHFRYAERWRSRYTQPGSDLCLQPDVSRWRNGICGER